MTYVSKKEKVFDLPEQDESSSVSLNNTETKLKRFPSVSDRRAWTSEECQRYQHLYGLVNGNESNISKSSSFKYIPFDVLLAILMAEKDAYIQELLEKQEGSSSGGKLYKADGFDDSDDDREALIRKDAEMVSLKNKIAGLESELEDYRDTLTKAMHKLENMDAIINENNLLKEKIQYSEETIKCLEERKAELERELEYYRNTYNNPVELDAKRKHMEMARHVWDGGDCDKIVHLSSKRDSLLKQVEELQRELDKEKMNASDSKVLINTCEIASTSFEEILKENECYKKKIESMKFLEKHVEDLKKQAKALTEKYKRETQKANDRLVQINTNNQELQQLKEEREKLKARVKELETYESQCISLNGKMHQVKIIIDENEILNKKLIEFERLELENHHLKMSVDKLKNVEIQSMEDKEKIIQLQCAVVEQEEEIRKLLKHIEELTDNYTDKNDIYQLRNELDEKNCKLKKYEKQLNDIPLLESEIDDLKNKLQKCIDDFKSDKDLLRRLQEELEACRKRCHEMEEMAPMYWVKSLDNSKMESNEALSTAEKKSGGQSEKEKLNYVDKGENTLEIKKREAESQFEKSRVEDKATLIVDFTVNEIKKIEEQNQFLKSEVASLTLRLSKIDLDKLLAQTNELKNLLDMKDNKINELSSEMEQIRSELKSYEKLKQNLEKEVELLKERISFINDELSVKHDDLKTVTEFLKLESKGRVFAVNMVQVLEEKLEAEKIKIKSRETLLKLQKEEANVAKQEIHLYFAEKLSSLSDVTQLTQKLNNELKLENRILRETKKYLEKTENKALKALISKLRAEVTVLKSLSKPELESECEALKQQIRILLNETDSLIEEGKNLKMDLDSEKSAKVCLEKAVMNLQVEMLACASRNAVLEGELSSKEILISDLREELSKVKNDLENSINESQTLKGKNEKLVQNINGLEFEQKELKNEINSLQVREEQLNKTIKDLEKKEEELNKIIRDQEEKQDELRRIIKNQEEKQDELKKIIRDQEEKQDELKIIIRDQEEKQDELKRIIKDQEEKQDELKRIIKDQEEKQDELKRIIKDQEEKQDELKRIIKDQEEKQDELKRVIKDQEEKQNELKKIIKDRDEKKEGLKKTIEELEKRMEEYLNKNKSFGEVSSSLKNEKQESVLGKEFAYEMQERIKDLETCLKTKEDNLKAKEDELESTKKELLDAMHEVNKLKSEMEVLKNRLEEIKFLNSADSQEFPNYEKDLEEKYALEETLRNLENELDELKVKFEECKNMEDEMANLRSKKGSLLEKMSDFEQEIESLKKNLCNFEGLKNELDKLKAEKNKSEELEISKLYQELLQHKSEVANLKKENAALSEELKKAENLLEISKNLKTTIPENQTPATVEFYTPPALPSPHSSGPQESVSEVISLEIHKKEIKDLENFYELKLQNLKDVNEERLKKLTEHYEKEAKHQMKSFNDYINTIKSGYENDIKKLVEKHKMSIMRLQGLHEDEVQELNTTYETQMEAMQTQNENLINDLRTEAAEKYKQLREQHNRDIRELGRKYEELLREKNLEFLNQKSNAEISLIENANDMKEIHQKTIDDLNQFYQNSIIELEEKHNQELRKCKKSNLKRIELMKNKYEALLVEERKKYEEQLEEMLLQLKNGQPGDILKSKRDHHVQRKPLTFNNPSLDFHEVLQKILNEGLECLTFEELILVHSKTCFLPLSAEDTGTGEFLSSIGNGCRHIELMAAEKEDLLKRIFVLEHEIVIKELETHEAIVNMEAAEICKIQELKNALCTAQQKNAELKRLLSNQSKEEMGLKIDRYMSDKQATFHETNVVEKVKELEKEKAEKKRLEEELQKEKTNKRNLLAAIEVEKERHQMQRKRDAEYVESMRQRLEEALSHEQMMETKLDHEFKLRTRLEAEIEDLQKNLHHLPELPSPLKIEIMAAKSIKNQEEREISKETRRCRSISRHRSKLKPMIK